MENVDAQGEKEEEAASRVCLVKIDRTLFIYLFICCCIYSLDIFYSSRADRYRTIYGHHLHLGVFFSIAKIEPNSVLCL